MQWIYRPPVTNLAAASFGRSRHSRCSDSLRLSRLGN